MTRSCPGVQSEMEKRSPRSSDHRETQRCEVSPAGSEVQLESALSAQRQEVGAGGHTSPLSLAPNSSQTMQTLSDINSLSPLLLWNTALIRSTENPGQREQETCRVCYQQPQMAPWALFPTPPPALPHTPMARPQTRLPKIILIRMTSKRTQSISSTSPPPFFTPSPCHQGATGGGRQHPGSPQETAGSLRGSR